jgi:hypothetical protein
MERREIARAMLAAGIGMATTRAQADNKVVTNGAQTAAEKRAGVTLKNTFYPPMNVFRYGATGTGETDDTPAIQAAIDVARVTGGLVDLPPGTYMTTSVLDIGDHSNIFIRGSGPGATIIKATQIGGNVIQFGGSSGAANCGISGIFIDCEAAENVTALHVDSVSYFWATQLSIYKPTIGVHIFNGVVHFYTEFVINKPSNYGFEITGTSPVGGNDFYLNNGMISFNSGNVFATAGILITANGGMTIDDVVVVGTNDGLSLAPAKDQHVEWLFISNLNCDTCRKSGISIFPTDNGLVKGCTFTGCWTSSCLEYGVLIGATSGATVDGIRLNGHRSFGNNLDGYATTAKKGGRIVNVAFDNCDASGNSASLPNTYSGFNMGPRQSNFSITNCRSGVEDDLSIRQRHGILINHGDSNCYTVVGNDLVGNSGAPLLDLGTGTTKIVRDNLGYNPIRQTAIKIGSSPYTFTNNTGALVIVYVQGGRVSSVRTAGGLIAALQTDVSVHLPQGESIIVTYSAAPTMAYLGT